MTGGECGSPAECCSIHHPIKGGDTDFDEVTMTSEIIRRT